MYCVSISRKLEDKVFILCEGKLTNPEILGDDLEKIIMECCAEIAKELIFDLGNVVMINEACYDELLKLEANYKIKFINSSMFIEEHISEISKTKTGVKRKWQRS